jgi:uncharacterized membrane protein YcaP (DUF421 family)
MWADLSHLTLSPLNLAFRALVVYVWILLLLRVSGKRQMGQMGVTEFVAILLISNAVQNSMNGGDNSLLGGLLLASVLIFLSWGISVLTYRSQRAAQVFEGTPTLVVRKGKLIEKALEREYLRPTELRTLLRKQGFHSLSEIESAILESDGTLSVTRTGEEMLR